MKDKKLIDFTDIVSCPALLEDCGGKFYGLYEANKIIGRMPQNDKIKVRVPQTKVIPFNAFGIDIPANNFEVDEVYDKFRLPKELEFEVKCWMARQGGRIAVRSSAKCEDWHPGQDKLAIGAGACDSFLNVKINEVNKRIVAVLKSLYNPSVLAGSPSYKDLQMAVIIQEMINPKISGVIYSQPFAEPETDGRTDTAKVVVHYVENKTAEQMIVNKEKGTVRKLDKFITTTNGFGFDFYDVSNLHQNPVYAAHMENIGKYFGNNREKYDEAFVEASLMKLSAIVNRVEHRLKHPIDMEFAVEANPKNGYPVINILQQRPYRSLDNFRIRRTNELTMNGYPAGGSEICGEVVVIEGDYNPADVGKVKAYDTQNKIILLKIRTEDEYAEKFGNAEGYENYAAHTIMQHHHIVGNECYRNAAAIVDTTGFLLSALYGHYGNELRQNEVPFVITNDKKYQRVENQDRIKLCMKKGLYESLSPLIKRRKISTIGKAARNKGLKYR